MADLSQITVLPLSQLQGPNQVAQGGTSHSSNALTSQPAGTVLQGFIVNRDAVGNPVVRTDKGDIPFSTNFFLKIGSEVVIRIGNSGGNSVAHLVSVDGQPPEAAQSLSAFSQEPGVILSPQLSQSLPAGPLTTPGVVVQPSLAGETAITVTGTIVAPPQSAQLQSSVAQPSTVQSSMVQEAPVVQEAVASNGTQLTLKILSISNSANAALPETPITPVALPSSTLPQATSAYTRTAEATPVIQGTASLPAQTPGTTPVTEPPATNTPPVASPARTTTSAPVIPVAETPAAPATVPTAASTEMVVDTQQPITPGPTVAIPLSIASGQNPVTPPPAQLSANSLQPGTSLTATVIGNDTSGETLVQSSIGIVRLQTGSNIPSGSDITFQILQATPPSLQNTPMAPFASQQPAPITELAQQWSSLQQIFSLLAGRSTLSAPGEPPLPSGLTTPDTSNTPASPTNVTAQTITSGLFSFIAALRSGNFQDWLGVGTIRVLQDQGQGELLKKAQAEFSTMANQFTQTPPNHWQALFFPFIGDGNVQQVRIFVKRDRKQGNQQNNGNQEEDARFVIEVGLSQLGELQMDGFVRRQDKNLQFDMVIRSAIGLPSEAQNDILRIYNDMGAITGYSGSITFQSVKTFPVNPMQEIAAHSAVTA